MRRTIRSELARLKDSPDMQIAAGRVAELNEVIEALNRKLTAQHRIDPIVL
ncbi:MAG TPA: hypothetical protein VJ482_02405 [Acidimicrobiia bacterium]|nr:hypothetical protein [Acidimicrobiia bacterium]